MSSYRAATGMRGEAEAAAYLEAHGYRILFRNYHCRYGEIDLVCLLDEVLVFCEVKLRRSTQYGSPEEAITRRKLEKLTLTAQTYLTEQNQEDADWRIDAVAIELDAKGAISRIELYEAIGN